MFIFTDPHTVDCLVVIKQYTRILIGEIGLHTNIIPWLIFVSCCKHDREVDNDTMDATSHWMLVCLAQYQS